MIATVEGADLYSGGGGFSEALEQAAAGLGLPVEYVAVNHWATAIATHTRNHPKARHLCADMYRTSPRNAVPGGRLDILIASPTCTFHSRARGGKPISKDQKYGRMTPTQVKRWCTDLDVTTLVVENVPEFVDWTTVHPTDPVRRRCVAAGCRAAAPCRARKGMHFRAWIRRLERLGYRVEWKVLNAADYGDATTRRRFFLLGRKDRRPIVWPLPTHSETGEADLFGRREKWRAAREVIDWSKRGKSIFRRKKPLKRPTILRIRAGAIKQCWPKVYIDMIDAHLRGESVEHWLPPRNAKILPSPFVSTMRQHVAARDLGQPIPTPTAGGNHIGLVEPVLVANRTNNAPKGPGEPLPAMTTSTGGGIMLAEPFVLSQASGGAARPVVEPVPTIPTRGAHELITPVVVPYYGTGVAFPVDDPLHATTTRDRFALVMPVTHHDGSNRARSTDEPIPTLTTANRGELALVIAANGERVGQAPRFRSADEPLPTACATGRIPFVEGIQVGAPPRVYYDILLRMLEPYECARAMSFPETYVLEGNKGQRMQQVGNAVAVRTAKALIRQQLEPFAEAMAA